MASKAPSLNTKQVQEVFGVKSHVTILRWRNEDDPLPHELIGDNGKPRVRFPVSKVKAWAKRYGIPIVKEPEAVLREAS